MSMSNATFSLRVPSETLRERLDLEHLSPGLYIARLEAEGIPVGEVKISLVK